MNFAKLIASIGATAVLGSLAGAAGAQENTLRLGVYIVDYHASAQDLSGPYTPPGLNLDVQKVNTPYIAYLRELAPHWNFELAAGVPPETHTVGKGPATVGSVPFNGQEVATVKWFSPTLLLNYKFCKPEDDFQPYFGLGVNYTHFYDRKVTTSGMAITGGPTSVSLSDSRGPAVSMGAYYKLGKNFTLQGSYNMATVKSDFVANTSGVVRSTTVSFHPTTWVFSVGYSFRDPWAK